MFNAIKAVLKSKTIQGLIVTTLAAAATFIKSVAIPGIMAKYGNIVTPALAILQVSGISWAAYGRWVASGPLGALVKAVQDAEKKPGDPGGPGSSGPLQELPS